jgi:hypothetical protein
MTCLPITSWAAWHVVWHVHVDPERVTHGQSLFWTWSMHMP